MPQVGGGECFSKMKLLISCRARLYIKGIIAFSSSTHASTVANVGIFEKGVAIGRLQNKRQSSSNVVHNGKELLYTCAAALPVACRPPIHMAEIHLPNPSLNGENAWPLCHFSGVLWLRSFAAARIYVGPSKSASACWRINTCAAIIYAPCGEAESLLAVTWKCTRIAVAAMKRMARRVRRLRLPSQRPPGMPKAGIGCE